MPKRRNSEPKTGPLLTSLSAQKTDFFAKENYANFNDRNILIVSVKTIIKLKQDVGNKIL